MRATSRAWIAVLAAAAACARPGAAPRASAPVPPQRPSAHGEGVVLFDPPAFPTRDGVRHTREALAAALAGAPLTIAASARDLSRALDDRAATLVVLPHGSAFPEDAWPALRRFLDGGGSALVLGGAPFTVPVREDAGGYEVAPRTHAYARALRVGPSAEIAIDPAWRVETHAPAIATPGAHAYALTLRLAEAKEEPREEGSEGPRDAVVHTIAALSDRDGTRRAPLAIEIDHVRGPRRGARWVFATTDGPIASAELRALVARARQGPFDLAAHAARSVVAAGEAAEIRVTLSAPRDRDRGASAIVTARVDGDPRAHTVTLARTDDGFTGSFTFTPRAAAGLARVEISATIGDARLDVDAGVIVRPATPPPGRPLSASRDWLREGGQALPIVGVTYMPRVAHRRFLLEPNPAEWARDLARLRALGVRLVRTGMWASFDRYVSPGGIVPASIVDAVEAFVLSAAAADVHVCFDLFAFTPPTVGDANPFLSPAARARQAALLRAIASRVGASPWVHWDLVNEPSYAPPSRLWRTLPLGDPIEARAFAAWASARHGSETAARRAWGDADAGPLAPPPADGLDTPWTLEAQNPKKNRDFREFAQEAVRDWARASRDVLRAAGARGLVTIGQDESGAGDRASPHFFEDVVDYTSVHTWFHDADLLWDGVVTKVHGKPHVHGETGVLRVDALSDAGPARTPEEETRLLERKIAYAFAARGAGAIEWTLNIDPYLATDEESTIGLVRPCGTAKPERDVVARYAAFFAGAAPLLDDDAPAEVAIVLPHARHFLGVAGGVTTTRALVRVLGERFGVVPIATSDLRLRAQDLVGRRLVIVPSPETLDREAALALAEAARRGARVLVTGPIETDGYGRPHAALTQLRALTAPAARDGGSRALATAEPTGFAASGVASFSEPPGARARRGAWASGELEGPVWHEALPIERAVGDEALVRLLALALARAGVTVHEEAAPGVAASVRLEGRHALVVCVNERSVDAERRVTVDGRAIPVRVAAWRARILVVDRQTGRVAKDSDAAP